MHWSFSRGILGRVRISARIWAKLGIVLALVGVVGAASLSFAPRALAAPVKVGECTEGTPAVADKYVDNIDYFFVAWVGCDSGHHINVEGTADPGNWVPCDRCDKRTLTSTFSLYVSDDEPGVALTVWNNQLYIAYVGSDYHIHVGWYNWTSTLQSDTRLSDTTAFTPALTSHLLNGSSQLYLAWTGMDSIHSLNFEYSTNGTSFTGKITGNDQAAAGPAIVDWPNSPAGWQMYVAWRATDSINSVCIGYYVPGSKSLNNHNCLRHCVNGVCNPIVTAGDVGLAINGSDRLYVAYHGQDYTGQLLDATEIQTADTSDGYNFHYQSNSDLIKLSGGTGTSIAYHAPILWQAWRQNASGCSTHCWVLTNVYGS